MTGEEFVRGVRRLGRERGVAVRFDPRAGKGSPGRLYYGGRFTTIKNRRKEIGAGLLAALLRAARAEPRRSLKRSGGQDDARDWSGRRTCNGRRTGRSSSRSPDIPEALTEGATEAEALVEAQDCVIAALGGYVESRHPIPAPSPVRGRTSVALPVLVAAKIALYGAMHEQGVGNTALAERLGLSEGAVRRLIDLDHRSHIGQVETALQGTGPAPDGCHASGVVRGVPQTDAYQPRTRRGLPGRPPGRWALSDVAPVPYYGMIAGHT